MTRLLSTASKIGAHSRSARRGDLNVIDLDRLDFRMPRPVSDLPAGGTRLTQDAVGYVATVVSGVVTRRNDADTGARPGRLVRSARLPTPPVLRAFSSPIARFGLQTSASTRVWHRLVEGRRGRVSWNSKQSDMKFPSVRESVRSWNRIATTKPLTRPSDEHTRE